MRRKPYVIGAVKQADLAENLAGVRFVAGAGRADGNILALEVLQRLDGAVGVDGNLNVLGINAADAGHVRQRRLEEHHAALGVIGSIVLHQSQVDVAGVEQIQILDGSPRRLATQATLPPEWSVMIWEMAPPRG